ncbi:transcriptional regulator with XRE-family HTH domain [Streptomyces sp. SAI-144]|uniref:helix-turn-helix domain-containing protein n=1 Tax=Streptomyces sp. SAI-144 TaxID=2940544 RepID=UPI0024765EC5|nr:helix-turn-helix transcriptional regulator [Streptomyces sp. SAI-144]MDH6432601.1 transcriptional regulator with XRE-family HTH domain [Streptomyces sp. SAI-144]
MTEEQKRRGPAATQVEATGQHVQANVARLRKARGWTTYQMAKLMKEVGRPIPQSGISRIESGTRRVDVDDLTALAAVFGVAPAALLLPLEDRPGARIRVTGADEVDAADAWDWAEGQRPLAARGRDENVAELEFLVNGVPRNRRLLRQHPAGRALAALQQRVDALVARSSYVAENDETEVRDVAEAARHAAERVLAEIDYLDGENARARGGRAETDDG